MKIFITKHAHIRMKERIGIKGWSNVKKLAEEAYHNSEEVSKAFLDSKYNMRNFRYTTYQYRQYAGFIYCFQERTPQAVCLLTIFQDDEDHLKRHAYDPKKTVTRDVI